MNQINRRDFLKLSGAAAAGVLLAGCSQAGDGSPASGVPVPSRPQALPTAGQPHLAVARGSDAGAITTRAIAALGGMERFVKQGADVIIKPNICVNYHTPEFAATTNPDVVAALVTLCLGAGAARVRVMDAPFGGTAESAYERSGIAAAVKAAQGEMEIMSPVKFARFDIPDGVDLTSWEFYRDILETDVLINVPIAKHHSLARLTLGGKNLLGTITKPSQMHRNLGQRIADLASRIRPTLTVVDAYRILAANGPTGGSLDDVKETHTLIASHDPVAADAYGATLFGLKANDISYVKTMAAMGLGSLDLENLKIEEIDV